MVKAKSDATSAISCRISASSAFLMLHWRLSLYGGKLCGDFSTMGLVKSQKQRQSLSERYKHSKQDEDTCAILLTTKETQLKTLTDGTLFSFSRGQI